MPRSRLPRWAFVRFPRQSDPSQVLGERVADLTPTPSPTHVSAAVPTGGSTATTRPSELSVVRAASPRQHMVVWLIGVLLASLIPFLFQYLHGLDRGDPPSIYLLLGHGDLLLISLVVTIAGITELVLVAHNLIQEQIMVFALVLLGSVLVIAAEALWYADIASQLLDGQLLKAATHTITYGSITLFAMSAFCSTVCVRLAAGAR